MISLYIAPLIWMEVFSLSIKETEPMERRNPNQINDELIVYPTIVTTCH